VKKIVKIGPVDPMIIGLRAVFTKEVMEGKTYYSPSLSASLLSGLEQVAVSRN